MPNTDSPEGVGTPTPQLQRFYLTFGTKYATEEHPFWSGATPQGWVLIEAKDESRARGLAYLYFREFWSMLYPGDRFNETDMQREFYPLGMIARIKVGHVETPIDKGVGVPTPPKETHSWEPMYYGVFDAAIVAVRIEGQLAEDPDPDGYDVEYFHVGCAEAGEKLFADVNERDENVRALELNWAEPVECPVCEVSIT